MITAFHHRLKAILLAAVVAAEMATHTCADIVYDCFKVVSYSVNWHIECTLDGFTDAQLFFLRVDNY